MIRVSSPQYGNVPAKAMADFKPYARSRAMGGILSFFSGREGTVGAALIGPQDRANGAAVFGLHRTACLQLQSGGKSILLECTSNILMQQ